MILNLAQTADQIKKAVKSIKAVRPAYAAMLEFYSKIFDVQTESRNRIQLEPLHLTEEMVATKARENLPLIDIPEFVYDENESCGLFFSICNFAKEANSKMAASAEILLTAGDATFDPKELFSGFLAGDEATFENIAVELNLDKQVLGFVTYNSLKPSLTVCAEQLSTYLSGSDPWQKGYCPICGSAPILSLLEDEGARRLICSFCWQDWSAKRGFCPFCENQDSKNQQYFYHEEEKEYRVDLCNKCKRYIKTIDTRKLDRLIYPPLEQISSLHLDINAKEMGYTSGIALELAL